MTVYLVGIAWYEPEVGGDFPNTCELPRAVFTCLYDAEKWYQRLKCKEGDAYIIEMETGDISHPGKLLAGKTINRMLPLNYKMREPVEKL